MKKIKLLVCLFLGISFYGYSQVKDISLTAAPTVEYTWWDNKTVLENSPLAGGRLGFGFGKYFEIRGLYMKSFDLKGTLKDINIDKIKNFADELKNANVEIKRWGGEMKANFGLSNRFSPYVTLGTGVQNFEFTQKEGDKNIYKEEQIYASAGLGIKFNLSDRIVLALEGRNTMFNVNPKNPYLKSDIEEKEDQRVYNWSALASLEIYLGGRNPETITELDKAYLNTLRGGFRGMTFLAEPSVMYVDFDDKSPFSDSYFLGGSIGFDITNHIGIRGFYYQATKEKINFDFNKELSMYGGNIIARLNENSTGVTPYLSLGGGYINPKEGYKNNQGITVDKGAGFAMGGLGLEIPLSKNFIIFGSANYLLTASKNVEVQNIANPSQLQTSMAYQAGIRIQLGRKQKDPNQLFEKRVQDRLDESNNKYQSEISELELAHKKHIEELNKKLDEAYKNNDIEGAVSILKEKKRSEKELIKTNSNYNEEMVRMSRSEFERLVEEVLRKVDSKNYNRGGQSDYVDPYNNPHENAEILEELKKIDNKTEHPSNHIEKKSPVKKAPTTPVTIEKHQPKKNRMNSYLKNSTFAVITGPSFGNDFAWNVGLRSYHPFSKVKNLYFMPEAYARIGGNGGFGISANVIYQLQKQLGKTILNPYFGIGAGLFNNDKTKLGSNIIVGTEFNLLKGKVFADFSTHHLFKENQVAVGYKFSF